MVPNSIFAHRLGQISNPKVSSCAYHCCGAVSCGASLGPPPLSRQLPGEWRPLLCCCCYCNCCLTPNARPGSVRMEPLQCSCADNYHHDDDGCPISIAMVVGARFVILNPVIAHVQVYAFDSKWRQTTRSNKRKLTTLLRSLLSIYMRVAV